MGTSGNPKPKPHEVCNVCNKIKNNHILEDARC